MKNFFSKYQDQLSSFVLSKTIPYGFFSHSEFKLVNEKSVAIQIDTASNIGPHDQDQYLIWSSFKR